MDAQNLSKIQPPELANQVIHAYADGLQLIYIAFAPVVGVGLLSVLFVKGYSLKRNVRRLGKGEAVDEKADEKAVADEEASPGAATASQSHASEVDEIQTEESHAESTEDETQKEKVQSKKEDLEAQQ